MRNPIHIITLVVALSGCLPEAPGKDRFAAAKELPGTAAESDLQNAVSAPNPTGSGPEYFGYWGLAMEHAGGDAYRRYASETSSYSNIMFISEKWEDKLSVARTNQLQGILMIEQVIFPWNSSVPHSDWRRRFDDFWSSLSEYHDDVLGFYLYDEPFWRNSERIRKSATDAAYTPATETQLYETLKTINLYIKDRTNKLTSLTQAYPELRDGMPFVDFTDWIGFNCYAAFGRECTDEKVRSYFALSLAAKSPPQKLMITMDSYWHGLPDADERTRLKQRIGLWQELIGSTDQVAAVTPFLYQNVPGEEELHGAESLPEVQELIRQYGLVISNRSSGVADEECTEQEYLELRPDVKAAGMSASDHYYGSGQYEGMCRPTKPVVASDALGTSPANNPDAESTTAPPDARAPIDPPDARATTAPPEVEAPIDPPDARAPTAPPEVEATTPSDCTAREYYGQREDVRAAGWGALDHYNTWGRDEGMCKPTSDGSAVVTITICSAQEYYRQRKDVRAAGWGALDHYNTWGRDEGICRPTSDGSAVVTITTCSGDEYLRQRPDAKAAGTGAIDHYNRFGKHEGMCEPVTRASGD